MVIIATLYSIVFALMSAWGGNELQQGNLKHAFGVLAAAAVFFMMTTVTFVFALL